MPATTGTHKDLRLLFFLLYCRLSDSPHRWVGESPTLRIGESGSRRLPVSASRGVADSPYRRVGESLLIYNKLQNFISQKLKKLFVRKFQRVFICISFSHGNEFTNEFSAAFVSRDRNYRPKNERFGLVFVRTGSINSGIGCFQTILKCDLILDSQGSGNFENLRERIQGKDVHLILINKKFIIYVLKFYLYTVYCTSVCTV